jgi:hypothetical protein
MDNRQLRRYCSKAMRLRDKNVICQVAKKAALLLLAVFVLLKIVEAASVNINGQWSLTIGLGNLQGGAGSDLTSTYQSPSGQVTMDVAPGGKKPWSISVARVDSSWNMNFVLSIMRTGSGSGSGTVSGGTAYLTITTTNQTFVTGTGSLTGIPLQEQLGGVSVSIPPASYSTTIQFTATDM